MLCIGGGSGAGVLAGAGDVTASTARFLAFCGRCCRKAQAIQRLRCQVSTMGRGEMGFREGGGGRRHPIKRMLLVWSLCGPLTSLWGCHHPSSRAGAGQVSCKALWFGMNP